MRIEVYGQPQGKQRARVCMRGGFAKAYTPETTASYERRFCYDNQRIVRLCGGARF